MLDGFAGPGRTFSSGQRASGPRRNSSSSRHASGAGVDAEATAPRWHAPEDVGFSDGGL
jgi:hypothetical protein